MPDQTPILTVTLNPALDLSATVDRVVPGPKLRLSQPVAEPGGGGINVARVVRRLGGQVRAFAVLGGPTGARLAALLAAEGIAVIAHPAAGDTRQSLAVTEDAGAQFRFVLPGPLAPEAAALAAAVAAAAPPGALVVLSGSQPPDLPAGFPARLAAALPGRRLVVDTSGAALAATVAGAGAAAPGIAVLRMDGAEAEAAAGRALPGVADTAAFCAALVARGVAGMVLAGRGAEGNVLATAAGRWLAVPPVVPVVSTTGAGDSFAGGLVLALARGAAPEAALLAGTAAAAAAVTTPGTALCRADDVARLTPLCRLAPL
jgi:6-phosphofructokinase 2